MIIKAGTYRWNDTLTPYDVTIGTGTSMLLPFTLPEFSISGGEENTLIRFSGADIVLAKDSTSQFYLAYDGTFISDDGGSVSGGDFIAYTDTEGWNAFETLNDSVNNFTIIKEYLPDDYAKTFIVPIDTEVDDDKGTWFTSNTTMLIEAGTYRWNDEIVTTDVIELPLEFSLPSIPIEDTEIVIKKGLTILSATETDGSITVTSLCYLIIQKDILSDSTIEYHINVYGSGEYGNWNFLNLYGSSYIASGVAPEGYGQIITITFDQYVPTTLGLWAISNWEKQGEEEETYTIEAGFYKFNDTIDRPSEDFSQEMSFAVVDSDQLTETGRYGRMETGRDMYLDFINVDSDAGIAFYAFEETSNGNIGFLWDTQTIQVLEPFNASAVFNDWFGASTEKIVNPDTLKAKIQSLIAKANSTTGKSDTDLTSGVNSLIEGYGQGDTPTFDGTIEIDGVPATDYIDYYEEGKTEGIAEGRQAQYDEFWDGYQDYGKRRSYLYAFRSFDDTIFYPKYDIICTSSANGIFASCEITDLKSRLQKCGVALDTSNAGAITEGFAYNPNLTRVPVVSTISTPSIAYMFVNDLSLIEVEKVILKSDGSQAVDNAFSNCPALESLTIEGTIGRNGFDARWSTKLSKASITSIINALSTTTSGLTVTLSLTAVKTAFETSSGANDGSTSEEWLALIAAKSNWTISLV